MAFVCKQTVVLVVRVKALDNNNGVLADIQLYFSLYSLSHTSDGLTGCISIVFFLVWTILTHLTTMLPVGSLKTNY